MTRAELERRAHALLDVRGEPHSSVRVRCDIPFDRDEGSGYRWPAGMWWCEIQWKDGLPGLMTAEGGGSSEGEACEQAWALLVRHIGAAYDRATVRVHTAEIDLVGLRSEQRDAEFHVAVARSFREVVS